MAIGVDDDADKTYPAMPKPEENKQTKKQERKDTDNVMMTMKGQ